MKTIAKILYTTLTILILGLLPFIVFTLITSKTDVIAGIQSFVVLTGSMQPAVPQGSIVYAKDAKAYNKGEVISFKQGNVVVTHRIANVKKEGNGVFYKTKGDANNSLDSELVAHKDVLGRSIFFAPYVGKFVMFLKTFQGFALFIIFPTVFFIVFELSNIRREIIKQVERKAMEKVMNNEARIMNQGI